MVVTDTVGLRVAVADDVDVIVWVRVTVDVRVAEIVAVTDAEALKEGVTVCVGVLDGVTEDVMETV